MQGIRPGRGIHAVLVHRELDDSVGIEPELLSRCISAVLDDRVRVIRGLAPGAREQPAADAVGFVAGRLAPDAAVERVRYLRGRVDVLHDVQLADARPVRSADRTRGRPQRPESGPVAQSGTRVGLSDRGRQRELPTDRRSEVRSRRLDPTRRPVASAVSDRGDDEMSRAVLVDVGGRVACGLDLTGSPLRSSTRIARAEVVDPVRPQR